MDWLSGAEEQKINLSASREGYEESETIAENVSKETHLNWG